MHGLSGIWPAGTLSPWKAIGGGSRSGWGGQVSSSQALDDSLRLRRTLIEFSVLSPTGSNRQQQPGPPPPLRGKSAITRHTCTISPANLLDSQPKHARLRDRQILETSAAVTVAAWQNWPDLLLLLFPTAKSF